jgi:hypothetical protein
MRAVVSYLLLSASECHRLGLADVGKALDDLHQQKLDLRWGT